MRDVIAQTRSARVTAALYRLGGDADASVIEKQAGLVFVAMLDHVLERRGRGFDIGQDSNGFYARPRSSSVGPARTLRDLRLICRGAIIGKATREEWTVAWAATPESIKRSLWKLRLIETKQKARRAGVWIRHAGIRRDIDSTMLTLGFAAEGFAMQTPKPHIVWPIIAHQFAKISKNPELKTRKRINNGHQADPIKQLLAVFIQFNALLVRDHIEPEKAHAAFLKIDEYRKAISLDTPGADE